MFNQLDWTILIIFFFVLPVLAATLPLLDTIIREQLPFAAAFRCREFWAIWFVYAVIALLFVLILHAKNAIDFGVIGFAGIYLGFPMLMQSKVLSWKDPNSGAETAIGFEFLLKAINQVLVPGMKDSLNELMASLQGRWLQLDPNIVGEIAKNYLSNRLSPEQKDKTLDWIDQLIKDANANPAEKDRNLRTLFLEVRKAGGPRGVSYVLSQCKKAAQKYG